MTRQTPRDAALEWARILRSVAAGDLPPAQALARLPEIEDDRSVPRAFWSARNKLTQWVEHDLGEVLELGEYLGPELIKLAERIEQHEKTRP